MKFRVPFTFSDIEILRRKSRHFILFTKIKKRKLDNYLLSSGENIDSRSYLSVCYRSFIFNLIFIIFISSIILFFLNKIYLYPQFILYSFLICGLIFFNQINYPRIFAVHKSRDIEKNLIPALQDMLVQLNSGVPIFKILVNISNSNYGGVSDEFKRIIKEISSGTSQIEVLEKYGKISSSEFFKRILWQISNGMRAGSDIAIVIKEGVKNLNEEQEVQIQNYGSSLNPIIMFYMLIAVILPSLGITFFILISSLLNIQEKTIQFAFFMIFGVVIFLQIMFLGVIKSKRPSFI